ncbi:MAG: hypothetical protein H6964_18070 [Chromatiaceae bacterium]|nr:hypothetical protein [Gammaproteobacteria bacterium]MCP5448888.1 hypothetical protein [Chromatiaceae bacterium]
MINWKALSAGIAVVIVLGLIMQLAFTSVIVRQMELNRNYPDYSGVINTLPYLVGFGGYFVVMVAGGFVTASIALNRVVLNASIVGVATAGLSLWFSISKGEINLMSLIFFALGVVFCIAGALFWRMRRSSS